MPYKNMHCLREGTAENRYALQNNLHRSQKHALPTKTSAPYTTMVWDGGRSCSVHRESRGLSWTCRAAMHAVLTGGRREPSNLPLRRSPCSGMPSRLSRAVLLIGEWPPLI